MSPRTTRSDPDNPLDDALAHWVPKSMWSGAKPFDPVAIVKELDEDELNRMNLNLQNVLTSQVHTIGFTGVTRVRKGVISLQRWIRWNPVDYPRSVPDGPHLETRLTHAALFADEVLVTLPGAFASPGGFDPLATRPDGDAGPRIPTLTC